MVKTRSKGDLAEEDEYDADTEILAIKGELANLKGDVAEIKNFLKRICPSEPLTPTAKNNILFRIMGVGSTLLPLNHTVDNNDIGTSQVVNCDSTVLEEVEKSASEEVSLQVPLENKEDLESLGAICDLENNKGDVAEAITPTEGNTLELSISSVVADETLSFGCQTPRESIFDPFAPGPQEAACAPKKVIRGTELPPRRQLNFESGDYPVKRLSYEFDDSEEEEEDRFLQGIHKMFLDLIISNQALESTGKDLIDASPPESCKTPVSKPLLTGIADTCPDAPLRPSFKVVKLSPSICRKLDFGSVSPKSLFVEENKE